MSEAERRLADTAGRVTKVVAGGSDVTDPTWTKARILLSNRRMIVVGKGGKRTIPLSALESIRGRVEVTRGIGGITNYSRLRVGEDVLLVATKAHREFELTLCAAVLDDEEVLVRHPSIEGGVVTEEDWLPARVTLGGDETVNVTSSDGDRHIPIELDDVGGVTASDRTIEGEARRVVEVEHTEGETSVETHLGGSSRTCSFLKAIFDRGLEANRGGVDLDGDEKQILMALYSGISPFEIPAFTGLDVEETEETYARLIDNDVLSEVRRRREVTLTPRGRNLASEAMNEE